jgi:hypothetical protein
MYWGTQESTEGLQLPRQGSQGKKRLIGSISALSMVTTTHLCSLYASSSFVRQTLNTKSIRNKCIYREKFKNDHVLYRKSDNDSLQHTQK